MWNLRSSRKNGHGAGAGQQMGEILMGHTFLCFPEGPPPLPSISTNEKLLPTKVGPIKTRFVPGTTNLTVPCSVFTSNSQSTNTSASPKLAISSSLIFSNTTGPGCGSDIFLAPRYTGPLSRAKIRISLLGPCLPLPGCEFEITVSRSGGGMSVLVFHPSLFPSAGGTSATNSP